MCTGITSYGGVYKIISSTIESKNLTIRFINRDTHHLYSLLSSFLPDSCDARTVTSNISKNTFITTAVGRCLDNSSRKLSRQIGMTAHCIPDTWQLCKTTCNTENITFAMENLEHTDCINNDQTYYTCIPVYRYRYVILPM